MKGKRPIAVYLDDILESISLIRAYTKGKTFAMFDRTPELQDAVARRLEIIGEAVKRIPTDARKSHPDIPWKQIGGMRDVLIHEYAGVSAETVWKTVREDLGALEGAIKSMRRSVK